MLRHSIPSASPANVKTKGDVSLCTLLAFLLMVGDITKTDLPDINNSIFHIRLLSDQNELCACTDLEHGSLFSPSVCDTSASTSPELEVELTLSFTCPLEQSQSC